MKYDVLEAPNRRTLRAMEKENSKIRELAKKDRNEQVRRLTAFARKRDKRVLKHKQELKLINEQNREKTQEERRKQIAAQKSQLQSADHVESEWTSMKSLERSLAALERRYDREQQQQQASCEQSKGRKPANGHEDADGDDAYDYDHDGGGE